MSHIDNTKIEAYDFPYDQSSFGQSNVDQKSLNPEEMIEEAARKREHRLIKNREAARECRRKKKEYIKVLYFLFWQPLKIIKCLENRVQVLENQNKALIEELHKLKRTYEDSGSRLQGISTDGTGQGQNVVNQTTNQISPQVALHLAMANPHLPLNNHPFT